MIERCRLRVAGPRAGRRVFGHDSRRSPVSYRCGAMALTKCAGTEDLLAPSGWSGTSARWWAGGLPQAARLTQAAGPATRASDWTA